MKTILLSRDVAEHAARELLCSLTRLRRIAHDGCNPRPGAAIGSWLATTWTLLHEFRTQELPNISGRIAVLRNLPLVTAAYAGIRRLVAIAEEARANLMDDGAWQNARYAIEPKSEKSPNTKPTRRRAGLSMPSERKRDQVKTDRSAEDSRQYRILSDRFQQLCERLETIVDVSFSKMERELKTDFDILANRKLEDPEETPQQKDGPVGIDQFRSRAGNSRTLPERIWKY